MSWTIDSAANIIAATTGFTHRVSIVFHFYTSTNNNIVASRLKVAFVVVLLLLLEVMVRPVMAAEQKLDEGKTIQTSLGLRYDYDSNIYDSNKNATGSGIGVLMPVILFSTAPERYTLLYEGEYGRYVEDSSDDYNDHLLSGAVQFYVGSRGEAEFNAATEKGHWARGSNQTEGIDPSSEFFPSKPDEFERTKWDGKFRYGAEGNRGRLRFGFGGSKLDNTNNRERTRFYDYETLFGSAGLSLFFNQRTAVVIDAVFTDISYDSTRPGEASLDSEDRLYLMGLTWEATAKTEGSIRAGIQQRSYDDSSLSEVSDPSWKVDVRWSPREYSQFDFVTTRLTEETFAGGESIETTYYKVAWTHQWSEACKSIISWAQRDEKFVGSELGRDQTLDTIYLGLRYPQGRLLKWEAGYTWQSRDSNINNLVYDGNIFSIGVNISI